MEESHRFLEAGFRAFRPTGKDAGTCVTTIARRERVILEHIHAGHPRPLEWADTDDHAESDAG
jgi:hypothetical protein